MELKTSPVQRLIMACAVAAIAVLHLYAAFPDPAPGPVAVCPKVEYRVLPSKDRRTIRIDTVTTIPPECR